MLNVKTLIIFNVAKSFNEFKIIFTEVVETSLSSSFAKNYYLFSSILTHFKFFRKYFEILDKHFDAETSEYITLKKIIIYDINNVQRQFVQII